MITMRTVALRTTGENSCGCSPCGDCLNCKLEVEDLISLRNTSGVRQRHHGDIMVCTVEGLRHHGDIMVCTVEGLGCKASCTFNLTKECQSVISSNGRPLNKSLCGKAIQF